MAGSVGNAGESFETDNAFFKQMIDLIPPKVYFDQDIQEQLRSKRAAEDTSQDEPDGGEELSKKGKNKKQKIKEKKERGLLMSKSVTQIQEEDLLNSTKEHFTEIKNKKQKKKGVPFVPNISPAIRGSSSSSTDDNRSKLRAKIEELQAKRKMKDEASLEQKRLKRKEKKLRDKQKKSKKKQEANAAKQLANSNIKGENAKTPTKPIYNSEGNLVYSKFDFTSTGKKKRKSDLTGKDYKRLLEKIEKRNEKLNKLKDKDEGAAANLQEKFKWDAALHKAEGEKVRDNPERLKKALKMKEKVKEKRKKKWEERGKNVEKLKEDKQNKRTRNINARKQAKKEKKIKKLQKKGRLIPGF